MPISPPSVEKCITVNANMSWTVHVQGRLFTQGLCKLLSPFPDSICGITSLQEIIDSIILSDASIFPGNLDSELVELIEKHGGFLRNPKMDKLCVCLILLERSPTMAVMCMGAVADLGF